MQLSLSQIKAASKCFRYLSYLNSYRNPPPSIEDQDILLIKNVITKAYRISMETEWKVEWKKILGWVDAAIFTNIDITNEEACEAGKKRIEKLLIFLSNWYKIYIDEQKATYINVPLEGQSNHNTIHGIVPILQIKEWPTILQISPIARTVTGLYNDIELRGLQWLLSETLDVKDVEVLNLGMQTKGGCEITKMYAGIKDHKRTKETIEQIGSLIELGMNFQSVTELCNSCPFKGRCKL